jgi:plastocyanin
MNEPKPLTSRRGFVAATSLSILSLYGLWAAFGAAPLPTFRLGLEGHGEGHGADQGAEPTAPEHGGHGAAGPSIEEFRAWAQGFTDRFILPDGSVKPVRAAASAGHAGHGAAGMGGTTTGMGDAAPVDVYLAAAQWSFEPSLLRLEPGVPYRFRMMALDVTHGASIRLGTASRIIRLRRGALVEQTLTFKRPGEHLVYCTVYCGGAHDRMFAKIVVA